MRRRIHRAHCFFGDHRDVDAHVIQRLRRKFFGAEWINVAHESVISSENLRILKLNPSLAFGRNRKDTGLHCTLPDVFEQRRVTPLGDDVLIDSFRFVGIQNFCADLLSIYIHGEVVDSGIFWNREDVSALRFVGIGIVENLIHLCYRHLILNTHRDAVIFNLKLIGDGERRTRGNPTRARRRGARQTAYAYWRINDDDAVGEGGRGKREQSN